MFLQALIIAGGIILSSFQASALCTQSSSGGVSCTCDDELPTCTNGETIQYNGSQWVCAAGGSSSSSSGGGFGSWESVACAVAPPGWPAAVAIPGSGLLWARRSETNGAMDFMTYMYVVGKDFWDNTSTASFNAYGATSSSSGSGSINDYPQLACPDSGVVTDIRTTTIRSHGDLGGDLQTFLDNNGCAGYRLCTVFDVMGYLKKHGQNSLDAALGAYSGSGRARIEGGCSNWTTNSSSSASTGLDIGGRIRYRTTTMACDSNLDFLCCRD